MSRVRNGRGWGRIWLFVVLVGGCSGGEADGDDGTTDGGAEVDFGEGVEVNGRVEQYAEDTARQQLEPVGGVVVCEMDEDTCVRTNDKGQFVLPGVPRNQEVVLSFSKEGWVPALRQIKTEGENTSLLAQTVMGEAARAEDAAADLGVELVISTGGVQFFAMKPGDGVFQLAELEGVSVELLPEQDDAVVMYLDDRGEPNADLDATSSAGVGLVGNLEPGEYRLRFSHPELDCSERLPEAGWQTDAEDEVRFRIYENHITAQIGMICQPPAND